MSDELKKRHILSNDQNSLVLSNENGLCCSFYDFSLINITWIIYLSCSILFHIYKTFKNVHKYPTTQVQWNSLDLILKSPQNAREREREVDLVYVLRLKTKLLTFFFAVTQNQAYFFFLLCNINQVSPISLDLCTTKNYSKFIASLLVQPLKLKYFFFPS